MSLTLKLSHAQWDTPEGPHRWTYQPPSDGPTSNGSNWGCSYSGPARLLDDTTREALEADVGGEFGEFGMMTDPDGSAIYLDVDAGGPYIWRLDEVQSLPSLIESSGFSFESNPAHDVEAWLGGVRQVTSLGEVEPRTEALKAVVNGNDPRFAYLCGPGAGIEYWTWMGPEKKTVRKVLMVGFENGETRVMLVERAWLLGPTGDTIERIVP